MSLKIMSFIVLTIYITMKIDYRNIKYYQILQTMY